MKITFENLIGTAFSELVIRGNKLFLNGEEVRNVLNYRVVLDGDVPQVQVTVPIKSLETEQIENVENDGYHNRGHR